MSLATWGKGTDGKGIVLPVADDDDIDRTPEEEGGGRGRSADEPGGGARGQEQGRPPGVVQNEPAAPWDPGPQIGWGAAHKWRLHPQESDRTEAYVRGAGDGPLDRTTYQ